MTDDIGEDPLADTSSQPSPTLIPPPPPDPASSPTSVSPTGSPTALPPGQASPAWPLPPADAAADPATDPMPTPTAPHLPTYTPTPASTLPPPPPPPPFSFPTYGSDAGAPTAPPSTPARGRLERRQWLAVAIVAAIVGAAVGAGVATGFSKNSVNNGVTIHESNSTPGAAVLSGNVTIPELVKDVIPAVVSIDVKSGGNEDEGTGMIITSNGEVVTNNHVIELFSSGGGSGSITVTQYGQTKPEPATLIGDDATKDVALLRINNASNLKTVTFGSSAKTEVGDAVVAIGNALGLAAGTPTVTSGIVSALGRSVTAGGEGTASENLTNLIQTDAAINPGNSGGPLIDTAGQVIGMNTAVAGTSNDGSNAQNIGFAIPIASVESLIPQLEKGGTITSGGGYLGVDITSPDVRLATAVRVHAHVGSGHPHGDPRLAGRRRGAAAR